MLHRVYRHERSSNKVPSERNYKDLVYLVYLLICVNIILLLLYNQGRRYWTFEDASKDDKCALSSFRFKLRLYQKPNVCLTNHSWHESWKLGKSITSLTELESRMGFWNPLEQWPPLQTKFKGYVVGYHPRNAWQKYTKMNAIPIQVKGCEAWIITLPFFF